MLARQVLYHFSYSTSHFVLDIFEIRSVELLARLASNHDPPDLYPLSN
jgi:hypothetical protein